MKELTSKLLVCITITQLAGCGDDKDKDKSQSPEVTRPMDGSFIGSPDYDGLGEVRVGNLKLHMPIYFGTGVWPLRIFDTFDYTVKTDLVNGSTKYFAFVRTAIQQKACDPSQEAKKFVDEGLSLISLSTETVAVRDWLSESETFKGKSFLRAQHEKGDETKNYRIAILLANEKVPECITWNMEINADMHLRVSFIEESEEFIKLQEGFEKTWKEIGAEFQTKRE